MIKEKTQKQLEETPERKMWLLFWSYELPRMERKHLNEKYGRTNSLPSLPKDSFELAIYKICELKFNTERYESNRAEWLSHGKNGSPLNKTVEVGSK